MSTANPQQPGSNPAPPAAPAPTTIAVVAQRAPAKRQIIIVSHSNLFYWWPVWACGFLMAIISFFGDHLASVPHGTKVEERVTVPNYEEPRTVLVFPKEKDLAHEHKKKPTVPSLHIAHGANVGVLFCAVLLLVIAITNIPLRGIWSFVVILLIFFMTIIFAIMDWWRIVFDTLSVLDIRINMAGYLVISGVLFVLWLLVFLLFDQQIYMIFEPGQLRVRQSIGDAEMSFDTTGMTTQKQRSDLFRHWILGLGSGDLLVRTAGAHPQDIAMNNVLFVGRKHQEIEEMLRSREVVAGPSN